MAIPSVNPMGRDDIAAEITGEARYANHVLEQLRRLHIDAELVGAPDRPSVVGTVRAADAVDTVMVASHLDTVPVDTMEIDPFDPRVAEGRLYGRGSCDTKGGMAALVAALERVLSRGRLRRNVIVVGEADEELGSRGVNDVLAHLGGPGADWVLATEPTELRIVTHHKGIAVAELEAVGKACHSSDPGAGHNAIVELSRAVLALSDLARALEQRRDPKLGAGTLSVGVVSGGQAPNIVPDRARLWMDRRLLPDEDEKQVRGEIEEALAKAGIDAVHVARCRVEKPPLGTAPDALPVRACERALGAAGLRAELGTVAFGTDAGLFELAGAPSVVMGPGSIARAHTAREYVEVDQVDDMTDFFVALLEDAR
ncbi:MAG: M20/M25/M40 family metallo-hydrolase [Proteobacteria bacterium]|nr:M20/M25/M40 family metallo-hydrolase [Pseudomonadota bacterium]